MADDESPHRRGYHQVDFLPQFARQLLHGGAGQPSGAFRVHQHARALQVVGAAAAGGQDEMPLRSEEHTSELQSLMRISYAVFSLKKTKNHTSTTPGTKASNTKY